MNEENYILGFNHGYLIGKHFPFIISMINLVHSKSQYLGGVQAGGRQYEQEKREYELSQLKSTTQQRTNDIDKD